MVLPELDDPEGVHAGLPCGPRDVQLEVELAKVDADDDQRNDDQDDHGAATRPERPALVGGADGTGWGAPATDSVMLAAQDSEGTGRARNSQNTCSAPTWISPAAGAVR